MFGIFDASDEGKLFVWSSRSLHNWLLVLDNVEKHQISTESENLNLYVSIYSSEAGLSWESEYWIWRILIKNSSEK